MSRGVQITSATKLSLPTLPNPPPPPMKLSLFDSQWICFQPIKRILLHSNPNSLSFPSLVQAIKSSLSATLLDYLPLAGKLTYVPATGDVEIDFSDPSVTFVEAESDLDLHRLATSEIHDAGSFLKLVPTVDVSVLPFPVFAVQVTKFTCDGAAVGFSAHHAAADGKALWQFVEAWTSACRAKIHGEALTERRKPSYDRALIVHQRGEEIARQFIRHSAPSLPITDAPSPAFTEESFRHLTLRTLELDAPSIQTLKQHATQLENAPPSTFLALAAHAWTCFARSKSFKPDQQTILVFLMDCRPRLDPPVDDDYFGNCVRFVYVTMPAAELTGGNGLARACSAIGKSMRDVSRDPLGGCEGWVADFEALPAEGVCNVAASPRFRAYESDFGWGKPDRVELVSMNCDGEIVLVGGREEGTVQVSVALNSNQIDAFVESFMSG